MGGWGELFPVYFGISLTLRSLPTTQYKNTSTVSKSSGTEVNSAPNPKNQIIPTVYGEATNNDACNM